MNKTDRQICHKNGSVSIITTSCHSEQNEEAVRFGIQAISERWTDPSAKPQDDNIVHSNKRTGFTLAEVLLVITIIGVVASLTLPNLITNVQNQQIISKYKKTYNALSTVTNLIKEEDFGGGNFTGPGNSFTSNYWKDFFKKHLVYIKEYDSAASNLLLIGEAGTGIIWSLDKTYADTLPNWIGIYEPPVLVLSDGTFVVFSGANDFGEIIIIDLNGNKPPNTMGLDIFIFGFNYLPYGFDTEALKPFNYSEPCSKTASTFGFSCGLNILNNTYNP